MFLQTGAGELLLSPAAREEVGQPTFTCRMAPVKVSLGCSQEENRGENRLGPLNASAASMCLVPTRASGSLGALPRGTLFLVLSSRENASAHSPCCFLLQPRHHDIHGHQMSLVHEAHLLLEQDKTPLLISHSTAT